MDLYWPASLFLLGLVPLTIAAYVWSLRRRRRLALRFSSLVLVRDALPRQSCIRRHLPFALFLLALISLVAALARPIAIVSVPAGQVTVMLAMDVSRSMCSTDIPPNRMETAKAAARFFVQRQEPSTQIGIVAFASHAELLQPPTADSEILHDVLDHLLTGRRTAVGSGILEALAAIAEVDPSVAPVETEGSPAVRPTAVPRGAYAPAIVVLLTDGASNQGPSPLYAAEQARDRGVRVYTIGFGTEQGGEMNCSGSFGGQGGPPFGGGFGGGGGFRRGIDEPTLRAVADMTGGTYYSAESASELQEVFRSLPTHLITRHETTEISVAFAALGALLAVLAVALATIWHPLP